MEDTQALTELALLALTGLIAAGFAVKLKLPTILGYLVAGILLGLALPNYFHSALIANIAQLGAALLLFTIGIEFSVETVKSVLKISIVGALVQGVLLIVLGVMIMPLFGFSDYESFLIGIFVSTSSTAFVVKMLETKRELTTRAGRIMMGWLVIQDLLVIAWFLLIQAFAPNSTASADFITPIIKAAILISITYGLGRFVLPQIFKYVAKLKSDELLIISVVGVIALFAIFANALGVSFTVGAFLAGLALSESFLNHEIFTETKPIRNLFIMIFFVSIGTILDLQSVIANFAPLLAIVLVLLVLKVVVVTCINVWFGVHIRNALKVATGIYQIGEFAFLGVQIALNSGWIDRPMYSLIVAATILSMSITPLLYSNVDWLYRLLEKNVKRVSPNAYRSLFMNDAGLEIEEKMSVDHVVICGYGLVGNYVATALKSSKIPFVAIEMDSVKAEDAQKAGVNVIYGDATSIDLLEKAGISEAAALVIALPDSRDVNPIVSRARELNPDILIVARTHETGVPIDITSVDHAVEPEFETSVEIITRLFKELHISYRKAVEVVREGKKS